MSVLFLLILAGCHGGALIALTPRAPVWLIQCVDQGESSVHCAGCSLQCHGRDCFITRDGMHIASFHRDKCHAACPSCATYSAPPPPAPPKGAHGHGHKDTHGHENHGGHDGHHGGGHEH